jgi:FKBP-type peptidyl-prolyl cis-trans isomerase 2
MPTVQLGDRVQVHYLIRPPQGPTASSRGRSPLEVTVGQAHPRLRGLGLALVGLTPGQVVTLRVAPDQGYGPTEPTRVRWLARGRLPTGDLEPGRWVTVTDGKGRARPVRILQAGARRVMVDANHPWAGQTIKLVVKLLAILPPATAAPAAEPALPLPATQGGRARVVTFDLDAANLAGLSQALPEWDLFQVNGVSADALAATWTNGAADLLVVGFGPDMARSLALCRFLVFCSAAAAENRGDRVPLRGPGVPAGVPLLAVIPPGHEGLVGSALAAGAYYCLFPPLRPRELSDLLARLQAGRANEWNPAEAT